VDSSEPVPARDTKVDSCPTGHHRFSRVSVVPVSASEVQAVLRRFPRLAGYHSEKEVDSAAASRFQVSRVSAAELKQSFPGVQFYRDLSGPVLAVSDDTWYSMPLQFNRLLFATGPGVNDSSMLRLAEAYVILSTVAGAEDDATDPLHIPPIAILDARELQREFVGMDTYDVYVKMRVGEEVQERYVKTQSGQVQSVYMKNPHLEEDMRRPPELDLCGTILALGYLPEHPDLVDTGSGSLRTRRF